MEREKHQAHSSSLRDYGVADQMIIGIDVTPGCKTKPTGIELYCRNIVQNLISDSGNHKYRLYAKTPIEDFFDLNENCEVVILRDSPFWYHTSLAVELFKRPVDVFYTPSHILPILNRSKSVYTIHDAGFRHYRKNYSTYQFIHSHINTYFSLKYCSRIIAISEFVAKDVSQHYKIDPGKISVIHNGFDPQSVEQTKDPHEIEKQIGIAGPFALFVGRLEQRKNVVRIIRAFAACVERGDVEGQLVLAGSPGEGYSEILEAIKDVNLGDKIILPGYISDEAKAFLFQRARMLVYPSLYEGFGLPILEAFSAGIPVITSSTTSCPEIAADAAIIVNPAVQTEISDAISRLWDDEQLRNDLIERGRVRCRDFGWKESASLILQTLENLNRRQI